MAVQTLAAAVVAAASPRRGSMPLQECLQKVANVFTINIEQLSQDVQKEKCFAALVQACQKRDLEALKNCKNALVQVTDKSGRNILVYSLASGDREIALSLIAHGFPPYASDVDGNTAAHYAARSGDVEMLEKLHAHNAPLYAQNRRGETPMHSAIGAGKVEALKAILRTKPDLTAQFNYENALKLTPLAYAAVRGEIACMNELMKAGASVDIPDNPIGSLLHLMVYFFQNDALMAFLKTHRNQCKHLLESKDKKSERTPLLLAARIGNLQAIVILNFFGANLEARDSMKRTAMHYAGMGRDPYLLEVIFNLGAEGTPQDKNRRWPIDYVQDEDKESREVRGLLQMITIGQKRRGDKIPGLILEPVSNLVLRCDNFFAFPALGAVRSLMKFGPALGDLVRVAGSSWSAIYSAFLAFDFHPDELHRILTQTDLLQLFDILPENVPFLTKALDVLAGKQQEDFDSKKERDWMSLLKMAFLPNVDEANILKIAHLFKGSTGFCKGDKIRMWIDELIRDKIKEKTGEELSRCTFKELRELRKKHSSFRHLHLFAAKANNPREFIRLSSEDPACDNIIISDAVRACLMSLFAPHILHEKIQGMRRPCADLGEFVACVMVYASAVEAFDKKKYLIEDVPDEEADFPAYNPQSLAVELRLGVDEEKPTTTTPLPQSPLELLLGIARIYEQVGRLTRQGSPYNQHRVIEIDSSHSHESPDELYSLGERVAKEFNDRHGDKVEASHALYNFPRLIMELIGVLSLPASHPHFLGRIELLKKLKSTVLPDVGHSPRRNGVFVLYGPDGLGKAEVAITFANQNLHEFSFVWVISCATPQEKISGYLMLAKTLNVEITTGDEAAMIEKVHSKLAENMEKPWFLILKNLNSLTFPFPKRGGIVFATGRQASANPDVDNMEVIPFYQQEDISMLMTGRRSDFPAWTTLTRWSGGSPLIVDLISCYLRVQKKTLKELESVLAPRFRGVYTEESKSFIIDLIIEQSLKTLSAPALEWIQVCANLNAGRIPWAYFESWSAHLRPTERNQIKRTLEDLSLLRFDPENNNFSLHLSVQEALAKLSPVSAASKALRLVETMGEQWDLEGPEEPLREEQRAAVWMEHAYKVSSYDFGDDLKRAMFFKKMGTWEEKHGNFPQALRLYKEANKVLETELKPGNEELLELWDSMGFCYLAIENWKEALKFLLKSINSADESNDEREPSRSGTLHNIGVCHLKQEKPQVAMSYFSRALEIIKKKIQEDQLEAAKCTDNSREQETIKRKIREDLLEAATCIDNIGNCHLEMDRFEEAIKGKEEVLPIFKQELGETHPSVVGVLETLAQCYGMLDQDEKAATYLKEALDIVCKELGKKSDEATKLQVALDVLRTSQGGKKRKCVIQ